MKSLLWKEFRLCWPILLVGAGLLTAPYLIPLLGKSLGYSVRVDWPGAAVFSLALSILTLTLFGGSAIACERADRSAEFLAYQPIPRGKILASKLVWPIAAAVVIWGVNLCVLFACGELPERRAADAYATLGLSLTIGLVCFSVAWFVSSLQDSPTYAVGCGVVAPIAIWLCFGLVNWLTGGKVPSNGVYSGYLAVYFAVILAVGIASFISGCWYYLHRVEP